MPIEIVYGNITEQDAEAILIPENALLTKPAQFEITTDIYNAAGHRLMTAEYCNKEENPSNTVVFEDEYADENGNIDWKRFADDTLEAELHPFIIVTKGYDLKAEYALHLDIEEDWLDNDEDDWDHRHRECFLDNCFNDALSRAEKLGVKSVATPLIGTCIGLSEDYARLLCELAVSHWLYEHNDCLTVYIVVPYSKTSKNKKPNEKPLGLYAGADCFTDVRGERIRPRTPDLYAGADCFVGYEKTLCEKIEGSKLARDDYFKKTSLEYLNRIKNSAKLSGDLGFDPSVITRFKNAQCGVGKGNVPKKKRVIAIAAAMRLSDYERFEFIRCAGYEYPAEKLDFQVEMIIRSGITSFEKLNEELCRINPEYDLTAPSKKSAKEK